MSELLCNSYGNLFTLIKSCLDSFGLAGCKSERSSNSIRLSTAAKYNLVRNKLIYVHNSIINRKAKYGK